jgi:hypothetical protein
MQNHPAARCFQDAYAADAAAANAYLNAANALLTPVGTRAWDDPGWTTWRAKGDSLAASFRSQFSGYFSDCR